MANWGVVTLKVPRDIEIIEEGCIYAIAEAVGIQGT
jgi:hypothetical protein